MRQYVYSSAPPGAMRGDGGNKMFEGVGYGGGGLSTAGVLAGGGGGYGGGGAGTASNGRGGAGGGGAIQITTRGALTVAATGSLEANGGTFISAAMNWGGGAGSGGGILLAAQTITVDGTVEATGGNATDANDEGGGGGGGGRVAFYSRTDWGIPMVSPYTNAPAGKVLIDGGTADSDTADDGARGTFYAGPRPSFLGGGGTVVFIR